MTKAAADGHTKFSTWRTSRGWVWTCSCDHNGGTHPTMGAAIDDARPHYGHELAVDVRPFYGPETWLVCDSCNYVRHRCGGCGEDLPHAKNRIEHSQHGPDVCT